MMLVWNEICTRVGSASRSRVKAPVAGACGVTAYNDVTAGYGLQTNRQGSLAWVLLGLLVVMSLAGCFRYSFTGAAIPDNVDTIYIPFFPDNSASGLADLSDQLSAALVNRFVNQTRLSLVTDEAQGDILINGAITNYVNRPFTVSGNETASLNRVQISVRASFRYADEERARFDKVFTGQAEYDPTDNPIDGELEAAAAAMQNIAQNMFNDSVGRW